MDNGAILLWHAVFILVESTARLSVPGVVCVFHRHVFPFLQWLCDSAVEAVFGRLESRGGSRGGAGRGKDGLANTRR